MEFLAVPPCVQTGGIYTHVLMFSVTNLLVLHQLNNYIGMGGKLLNSFLLFSTYSYSSGWGSVDFRGHSSFSVVLSLFQLQFSDSFFLYIFIFTAKIWMDQESPSRSTDQRFQLTGCLSTLLLNNLNQPEWRRRVTRPGTRSKYSTEPWRSAPYTNHFLSCVFVISDSSTSEGVSIPSSGKRSKEAEGDCDTEQSEVKRVKLHENREAESEEKDSSHLEAVESLSSTPVSSKDTCSQENAVVTSGETHDTKWTC